MVFLEALRQLQFNVGRENMMFVHVSLVPVMSGEMHSSNPHRRRGHSCRRVSIGVPSDTYLCMLFAPRERICVDVTHVMLCRWRTEDEAHPA